MTTPTKPRSEPPPGYFVRREADSFEWRPGIRHLACEWQPEAINACWKHFDSHPAVAAVREAAAIVRGHDVTEGDGDHCLWCEWLDRHRDLIEGDE